MPSISGKKKRFVSFVWHLLPHRGVFSVAAPHPSPAGRAPPVAALAPLRQVAPLWWLRSPQSSRPRPAGVPARRWTPPAGCAALDRARMPALRRWPSLAGHALPPAGPRSPNPCSHPSPSAGHPCAPHHAAGRGSREPPHAGRPLAATGSRAAPGWPHACPWPDRPSCT